jgi:hypothetical protein
MAWLALVAAGCGTRAQVVLTPPSGAASIIVAVETSVLDVRAIDVGGLEAALFISDSGLTTGESAKVSILAYSSTLEQLGVSAGPIAPQVGEPSRGIPVYDLGAYGAAFDGARLQPLVPTTMLSPALYAFRFRWDPGDPACIGRGGCFDQGRCVVPCPTPPAPAPPATPADPATAAGPVLTPCPAGWAEVSGDPTWCEPWPGGSVTCPAGEARWVGTSSCAPTGSACPPAGVEWPVVVGSSVLYVRAGASGTTGSQADPFGTIAAALAAAGPGTVVVLNRATFAESVSIPAGVELRGACARDTIVRSPSDPAVHVAAGGARLVDLAVVAQGTGIEVSGGSLDISGVEIRAGSGPGIHASGTAMIVADGVVVGGAATGLLVEDSATASVTGAIFARDVGAGVLARSGASAELDKVAIEAIAADASGVGIGLVVDDSARVSATRTVIEGAQGRGAWIRATGAQLALTDALVRSTAVSSTLALGRGVEVNGGRLTVRRAVFDSNREAGIYARAGSSVDLADLIARRTTSPDKGYSAGVEIFDGTRATMARVNADLNDSGGVLIAGPAATATITDLVVRGIATRGVGSLAVYAGGRASVTRASFEADHWANAHSTDPGSWLLLSDATILDSAATPADPGVGALIENNSHASLSRVHVERSQGYGVGVYSAATASIADLVVRDTRVVRLADNDGTAMAAAGAAVTIERGLLESNRRFGIEIYGPAGRVDATDLAIHQTLGSTTGGVHCFGYEDQSMGEGIAIEMGAVLRARRLSIDESHGANLVLCADTGDPGTGAVTASISDALFSTASALQCTGRADCPDASHAYSIEIVDSASLTLHRFVVEKDVRGGVGPLPVGANVTLTDGVISDEMLGLSYAGESRPIDQLLNRVLFQRDQQNVQLPPPPGISPP